MSGLHQRIRDGTRREHDAVEAYPFSQELLAARLPLSAYVDWVRAMTAVVGQLERELDASRAPEIRHLWQPSMRKLALLRRDAERFDEQPSVATLAVPPALALADELRRWGEGDAARLVGALYVFEGSVLGSVVLRKKVRDHLVPDGGGVAYLSAYGDATREQWRAFAGRLDSLELGEDREALAIDAARTVFRMLGDLFETLHPAEVDNFRVVRTLNPAAGKHAGSADPREVLAAVDAGSRTWTAFPYFECRYGESGRRFTRSDSAWIVTLATYEASAGERQIDWLARLLADRGMPSVLLEHHLTHLCEALTSAVPERRRRYARLAGLADHLRSKRLRALPQFEQVAAAFSPSEPLANVGLVVAGAVADARLGVSTIAADVERWLTDPARFPPDWCEAVRRAFAVAQSSPTDAALEAR